MVFKEDLASAVRTSLSINWKKIVDKIPIDVRLFSVYFTLIKSLPRVQQEAQNTTE